MGGQNSKNENQEILTKLNYKEVEVYNETLNELTKNSTSFINLSTLEKYFVSFNTQFLNIYLKPLKDDKGMIKTQNISILIQYLYMDNELLSIWIYDNFLQHLSFIDVIDNFVNNFFASYKLPNWQLSKDLFIKYLLENSINKNQEEYKEFGKENLTNKDSFIKYCKNNEFLICLIKKSTYLSLFYPKIMLKFNDDDILSEKERVSFPPSIKDKSELLDIGVLYVLLNKVPKDCRNKWDRLYSSELNGLSWNAFKQSIIDNGSLLIVIKEKEGNIFGGFVEGKVLPGYHKFYGSSRNFLFTLKPRIEIFLTTGFNTNFLYFNSGTQTLPNGFCMGGQFDYGGLWIDEGLNFGHSKAEPRSSTYGNTQLSKHQDFTIESVEVWCVKEPERDENDNKLSILDSNPEAAALLEMTSHKMYSKDVRDPEKNE